MAAVKELSSKQNLAVGEGELYIALVVVLDWIPLV